MVRKRGRRLGGSLLLLGVSLSDLFTQTTQQFRSVSVFDEHDPRYWGSRGREVRLTRSLFCLLIKPTSNLSKSVDFLRCSRAAYNTNTSQPNAHRSASYSLPPRLLPYRSLGALPTTLTNFFAQLDPLHLASTSLFSSAFLMAPVPAARGREESV